MRCLITVVAFACVALQFGADATALFNQGVEHQRNGRLQEARQAYEQSLTLHPDRIDALSNLGLIHLRLGDHAHAIDRFRRVLSLKPDLSQVRTFLALAYYSSSHFGDAAGELKKVLAAQPANPQALHLSGLVALKLGNVPEGIAALEQTLKLVPKNREAAITLATAWIGVKEVAKAEELIARIPSLRGEESSLLQGGLLNAKGAYGEAVSAFEKALQQNPKLPTAHGQLGVALMMLGDHARAVSELQAELAVNEHDYTANANLGLLYLQEKRYEEAAVLLARARRARPDDAGLLYLTAQVHSARNEHADAAKCLESVVKQRPNFIPGWVLLARSYARLKRPAEAARLQATIRQLTEQEQLKNLKSSDAYAGTQPAHAGDLR